MNEGALRLGAVMAAAWEYADSPVGSPGPAPAAVSAVLSNADPGDDETDGSDYDDDPRGGGRSGSRPDPCNESMTAWLASRLPHRWLVVGLAILFLYWVWTSDRSRDGDAPLVMNGTMPVTVGGGPMAVTADGVACTAMGGPGASGGVNVTVSTAAATQHSGGCGAETVGS